MQPIGYKIALELQDGADGVSPAEIAVKELPIDFRDRSVGSSKMNWRQQLNFLRHLYRLYRCKFGRVLAFRFLEQPVMATIIGVASL